MWPRESTNGHEQAQTGAPPLHFFLFVCRRTERCNVSVGGGYRLDLLVVRREGKDMWGMMGRVAQPCATRFCFNPTLTRHHAGRQTESGFTQNVFGTGCG